MFLGCETHTLSYLLFTYVYSTNLNGNTKNLPLLYYKLLIITLQKMFLGLSKYENTSYLYTLFDIQCCQSVIRKLVYGFMCRLDSYVNYIIMGILATGLRYTSRIRKHYYLPSVVYYLLIVDRTNYIIHIAYNLLHVNLDDNFIIICIWTSDCYVLLVCI